MAPQSTTVGSTPKGHPRGCGDLRGIDRKIQAFPEEAQRDKILFRGQAFVHRRIGLYNPEQGSGQ